jgi:hypothetical protein
MFPAMAANLTNRLWEISDIVKSIEDWEAVPGQFPSGQSEGLEL